MNGKRAKSLRRLALMLLQKEGITGGDGYNQYKQVKNCVSWEPAYKDGKPHDSENNLGRARTKDPDGNYLITPIQKPGTIFTQWKFRIIYQNLKRLWKQTNGQHKIFRTYL
jgi:hypothetical protein